MKTPQDTYENEAPPFVAEAESRDREVRLEDAIVANMTEGVCLVRTSDNIIVYANPRFERMFGYAAGELTGRPVSTLNAPGEAETPEQVAERWVEFLEHGGEGSFEVQNIRKDGTTFWCRARCAAFEHPTHGRVWLAVQQDVTEAREAQLALQVAQEALEDRVHERTAELTQANRLLQVEIAERRRAEARLFEEAECLSAIIATQHEIAAAAHESSTVLTLIAQRTQQLTRADGAAIDLIEADHLVRRVGTGLAGDSLGMRLGRRTSLSGECIRTRSIVRCNDTETDPRADQAACRSLGIRAVVVLPLLRNGEPIGVLKVVSTRAGGFPDRHVHTMELMAGLVGSAMSNAAEFEAEQALVAERSSAVQALEMRGRQQNAVAELSQRAMTGENFQLLLNETVEVVRRVLAVDFSEVLERVSNEADMQIRASSGWETPLPAGVAAELVSDLRIAPLLLSPGPVIIDDVRTEQRFALPLVFREHQVTSSANVLISGRRDPCGVIGAHSIRKRVFTSDEVHFLQAVANVLAAAMERRQLEEELLATSGREQQRIGQDLHDGLCQDLFGLELRLSLLAQKFGDSPAARDEATRLSEYMRKAVRKAQMLARGLSPIEFKTDGLMSALEELARHTSELFRVACEFRCVPPVTIRDNAVATHLYRIAQEAIHNAIKHGNAKYVVVELSRSETHGTLSITDDGEGFASTGVKPTGMGMRIMNYRAELVGAILAISPGRERGAVVRCTFTKGLSSSTGEEVS